MDRIRITSDFLIEYYDDKKLWKLLVSDRSFINANYEQTEKFMIKLMACYKSNGVTFYNLLGDIVWDYDITLCDVSDIFDELSAKLVSLSDNNVFKFIVSVNRQGKVFM